MSLPAAVALLLLPASLPADPQLAPGDQALPPASVEAVAPGASPEAPIPAAPAPAEPDQPANAPITVTGRAPDPGDPFQKLNVESFKAIQSVDKALVKPVADAYTKTLPNPVRKGLHNFLHNLDEPIVFVNFVLQHKFKSAARTLGRFTINSTIGVAGFADVAKTKTFGRLTWRPNSFEDTFGYYGIGQGPYFFLPIVGPTTLRDGVGLLIDRVLVPWGIGKAVGVKSPLAWSLATGTLRSIDDRVRYDPVLKELKADPVDPYTAEKRWYLDMRQAEIDDLKRKKPILPENSFDPPPSSPGFELHRQKGASGGQGPSPLHPDLCPEQCPTLIVAPSREAEETKPAAPGSGTGA